MGLGSALIYRVLKILFFSPNFILKSKLMNGIQQPSLIITTKQLRLLSTLQINLSNNAENAKISFRTKRKNGII
jgi:hypothetical protein